ncbi:synaptogenesis protein syg-2-like isoform X2 [Ptychodera flava]|uniref:synaptogenesis protein syg-2-like isoform X2 n=1 Tax=Ptychodera flava TaxID=63121 RepID=UPI003969DD48
MSIFFPPNHTENCLTQLTKTTPGTELIVDQLLTLQCTSCSSNPPADILWYMDDREMKSSNQAEHSDGYFNGTISEEKLHINLTYKHNGRSIHCVATSRIFSGQTYESKKINLDVHYAPFPADERFTRRVAVSVGKTATLQCQMKGNPTLSMQWYDQDRSELQPDDNRRYVEEDLKELMQESTLYIQDVSNSDYGRYYCRGENKHGDVEIVIILSRISAPDAVSNIKISVMADITTVHWTPGFNGGNDQKFYVEYVQLPEGVKKTTEEINDNELGDISVNISGLVEGSRYNITVVSKNDIGENRSSALTLLVEVTTIPAAQQFESRVYPIIGAICIVFAVLAVLTVLVIKNQRRKRKEPRERGRESHHKDPLELTPLHENVEQRTGQMHRNQGVRQQGPFDDDLTCDVIQPYKNLPNVPEQRNAPPFFTNVEEHSAVKRNEEISAKSPKLQIQSETITSRPASPESRRKSLTEDEDASCYALLENPVPLKENTSTNSNNLEKSKTNANIENANRTPTKCKLDHVETARGLFENLPSRSNVGSSLELPEGDHAATALTAEQHSYFPNDGSATEDSDGNTYDNLQGISRSSTSTASDPRPELPRKKLKANVEGLIYAELEHFGRKQPHTGRIRERQSDPVLYATIDHAKTSKIRREQQERAEHLHDDNAPGSSNNTL